jgi:hypothetical protein
MFQGFWPLATCYWLLAVGHWLLAAGYSLLVRIKLPEASSKLQEAGYYLTSDISLRLD